MATKEELIAKWREAHPDEPNWKEIPEFPNYQISDIGTVNNAQYGNDVKLSITQYGLVRVGLTKNRIQYTRSVALLVAEAFVEKPDPNYNTPIHLDGDRLNCRADNLMWRPRWFAIAYHKQFRYPTFTSESTGELKIVEVQSGKVYNSVKEACIDNGVYYYDVIKSFVEETFVPVTWQEFRLLD